MGNEVWEKKDTFRERYTIERIKDAVSALPWGFNLLPANYRHFVFINALLSVIPSLIGLYSTYLNKELVNSAIYHNMDLFRRMVVIYVGITVFNLTFGYFYNRISTIMRNTMSSYARKEFYKTIFKKEYGYMEKIRIGELLNRLQNDLPSIIGTTFSFPRTIVSLFISLVGSAYIIINTAPEIALLAFPMIIIVGITSRLISKEMSEKSKIVWEKGTVVSSLFVEHLSNMLIFHTFGREDVAYEQVSKAIDDLKETELDINRINSKFGYINNFMMSVISSGATIYFLTKVTKATLSFGDYTMLTTLIARLQGEVSNISSIIPTLYNLMISSKRCIEIEQAPNDLTRERKSEKEAIRFYDEDFKSILMKDVSFKYPQENRGLVLDHFNLEINKHEFVAITGISGCGKSTMQRLMLGLYRPTEGELYLKKNNDELEPLDSAWRTLFSYVPQRNFLFYGTIREAIAFGNNDNLDNDDGFWNALKIACGEDFVRNLPDGLDSQIGEQGTGLSEGQVQRLAIARAIYTDRPILLLDECTSSLDEQTERKLLENLKAMTDKTVIIVTHRPAALQFCDREIKMVPVENKYV